MTANSSSGSKYYDLQSGTFDFKAINSQLYTPSFSNVEITPTAFTVTTYRVDTLEVIDQYTIRHTDTDGSLAKAALQSAVNEAKATDTAGFTPSSVSAYQKAIQSATDVLNHAGATQTERDNAANALTDARTLLVRQADNSGLLASLQKADGLKKAGTADHAQQALVTAFDNAYDAALTLSADRDATQQQLDDAAKALNAAVAALQAPAPDTAALSALVGRAKALNASDYTDESFAAVQSALKDAQAILARPIGVSAQAVRSAAAALQSAVSGVVKKPAPPATDVEKNDPATGVAITAPAGVIPADTELNVAVLGPHDKGYQNVLSALRKDGSLSLDRFRAFEITLHQNGVTIEPNGKVQVTLPIPTGFDKQRLALLYVDAQGNGSPVPFTITGDGMHVTFEASHFSTYVLAQTAAAGSGQGSQGTRETGTPEETSADVSASNPKTGDRTGRYMDTLLAAALLSAAGAVLLLRHGGTHPGGD